MGGKLDSDSICVSASPKAVFLSYASQDAEAARRICDALRAVGLDVWFDQSALRGGDAWDASIDPLLRSLHADPRWEVFLRKIGLAD